MHFNCETDIDYYKIVSISEYIYVQIGIPRNVKSVLSRLKERPVMKCGH